MVKLFANLLVFAVIGVRASGAWWLSKLEPFVKESSARPTHSFHDRGTDMIGQAVAP